jgi:hypothetical protein
LQETPIIVLDGNRMFGMALDITRLLNGSGEGEDVIIISVGTPFDEAHDWHHVCLLQNTSSNSRI